VKREYLDYLDDLLSAMEKAMGFIVDLKYADFKKDEKTAYAVIRAIEIIGEAAGKIPVSVKLKYPDVPWKEMAGMRHKLVHEYFGVKLNIVWDTVKNEIPPLHQRMLQIVDEIKNK